MSSVADHLMPQDREFIEGQETLVSAIDRFMCQQASGRYHVGRHPITCGSVFD